MAKIKQPNGMLIKGRNVGASLVWSSSFSSKRTADLNRAQAFIDSECIRQMAKYTPERSRTLIRSATIGTKIGSGHIVYLDPKARYQYYGKLMVSSVTGSAYARRGEKKVLTDKDLNYTKATARALWFEVMKANHGKAILRGAAKIMGGKA